MTVTIKLTTALGTNASAIGESYGAYDGVSWDSSVDRCDSDGHGRVFLQCDESDRAWIEDQLDADPDIVEYEVV